MSAPLVNVRGSACRMAGRAAHAAVHEDDPAWKATADHGRYSHMSMSTLTLDVRAWGVFRDEVELRAAAWLLSELAAAAYDAPKKYSCAEVLRAGHVVVKDYLERL
eukprot:3235567-Amphidinium_carterae.1